MGKSILQSVILVVIFFALWGALGSVPWMKKFNIQEFTQKKQEQIADLVLEMHRAEKEEIESAEILDKINKIMKRLCEQNRINGRDIRMHVFEDGVVNAFALPGGHIVVNTALIDQCDNVDMLAGVMAHELAHVQLEHVSRKLSREIGMSALLVLTGGSEHMGTIKDVLNTLSSRSFDRDMEREADKQAIEYMKNAKGDPRQLAYFLQELTRKQEDMPEVLQWISTHPGGKERVDYIIKASPVSPATKDIISKEDWDELKSLVKKLSDGE